MSTTPHTPAMRIKSHWFKPGAAKTPADHASAMAFIVWRVAQSMLKRMRGAQFDIDAGQPYFAFMREVLVFLVAVTDRIAHARLEPEARVEFTVALVRHLARILQENEDDVDTTQTLIQDNFLTRFAAFINSFMDDDTAAAVSEIAQTKEGVRIKFHDKKGALVEIGRHLGMFTDKLEHGGSVGLNVTVKRFTPETSPEPDEP